MRIQRIILVSLALIAPCSLYAAAIQVDQLSPGEYGTWTLLMPSGSIRTGVSKIGKESSRSFSVSETGSLTLSTTLPAGMSARISTYHNDEFTGSVDLPQLTFDLLPNDNERFVIQYAYTQLGSLGITSKPNRARFRMKGPARTFTGTTPRTFTNIPAGSYTLTFRPTRACGAPARKTILVKAHTRNVTHVTLPCDTEEDQSIDRSRPTKRSIREAAKERELKPRGERK